MMLPRVSSTDRNTIVRVTASTPGATRNPTSSPKSSHSDDAMLSEEAIANDSTTVASIRQLCDN